MPNVKIGDKFEWLGQNNYWPESTIVRVYQIDGIRVFLKPVNHLQKIGNSTLTSFPPYDKRFYARVCKKCEKKYCLTLKEAS